MRAMFRNAISQVKCDWLCMSCMILEKPISRISLSLSLEFRLLRLDSNPLVTSAVFSRSSHGDVTQRTSPFHKNYSEKRNVRVLLYSVDGTPDRTKEKLFNYCFVHVFIQKMKCIYQLMPIHNICTLNLCTV